MYYVSNVVVHYHMMDIIPVTIMGLIGGVLGSLYNYLLHNVLRLYSLINERGKIPKILLSLTVSVFTSACLYGLPFLVSCTQCDPSLPKSVCPTSERTGNFKKFNCPDGYYNDLASLLFTTNDDALEPFSLQIHQMSPPLLIIDLLFRLLCVGTVHIRDSCPIWTLPAYHSYRFCIWTPAWHSYGELYKHRPGAFRCSWCSLPHGWLNEDDSFPLYHIPRTYQQSSLTSYNNDGASDCKTVGDCFNPIIYEIILELKGLPFVDANPEPWMRNINVAELADAKPPLFTLRGAEKVAQIVEVLRHTTHNGFPAVDDNAAQETGHVTGAMELHGLILRTHLVAALKKKWFQQVLRRTEKWEVMEKFSWGELAEREAKFKSVAMSKDEMEMYVDLHPLTNKTPYTVVEDMSAAKAMVLFRQVALRHLPIVPKYQASGVYPVVES